MSYVVLVRVSICALGLGRTPRPLADNVALVHGRLLVGMVTGIG